MDYQAGVEEILREIKELCYSQTCQRMDMKVVAECKNKKELIDYMHSVYSPVVRLLEFRYIHG
jgi:hypothetical protein